MENIIKEPTRVTAQTQTLIDPIAVTAEITIYDSGILRTPSEVSDHYGTYVYLHCNMPSATPFKRKVWNYKRADFNLLNFLIQTTDWTFILRDSLNAACDSFQNKLLEICRCVFHLRLVTIRPNDKPWYNSDIT